MSKYDWSNISKQVKFIIIDSDGTEYHLKKKPKFDLSKRYKTGSWFFNKSDNRSGKRRICSGDSMRGAGFVIRCHRCGKLKEPSQFRKLKPVWCTWCINCENTPIGMMPSN